MADGVALLPRSGAIEGEVLEPGDTVAVALVDQPFAPGVRRIDVPAGATILDLLETAGVPPRTARRCVVLIGDAEIPLRLWDRVRPKPGATVTVGVRPAGDGGGGGSNPLRVILRLAVAVASAFLIAIGMPIAGALVSVLGNMAIDALVPPPRIKPDAASAPSYGIEGASNELRLFGRVPCVLGRRRLALPYAARPFTEVVGDDLHLRLLLTAGIGPALIEDIRIGQTPIGEYEGVEVEVRTGQPGEPPITLITTTPRETPLTVVLTQAADWVQRETEDDTDEISIDFTFVAGLFRTDDRGRRRSASVTLEVEWRRVGEAAWSRTFPTPSAANAAAYAALGEPRLDGDLWGDLANMTAWRAALAAAPNGAFTFTAAETKTLRRNVRWAVPRGRYQVRVRRASPDTSDTNVADEVSWTALRAIRVEAPRVPPGTPLVAIRVKASDQLQGRLDTVTARVTSIRPRWTGSGWGPPGPTRNPADLFRSVLLGPGNARPVAAALVDEEGTLADWAQLCADRGWNADLVIDDGRSVGETLQAIASCARARAARRAGRYGVVIDVPRASTGQLFGPRNTRNFKGTRTFRAPIHAVRARFPNEDAFDQADERTVFAPGFTAANATAYETLEFEGLTSPRRVAQEVQYWLAVNARRRERFIFDADAEHLVAGQGDVCFVTHDVLLQDATQARVVRLLDANLAPLGAGATQMAALELDEVVTMRPGQTYGLRVRRPEAVVYLSLQTPTEAQETTIVRLASVQSVAGGPAVGDLVAAGPSQQETIEAIVMAKSAPDADGVVTVTCEPHAQPFIDQAGGADPGAFQSLILRPFQPAPPAPTLRGAAVWREDGVVVPFEIPAGRERSVSAIEARWRETPPAFGVATEWQRLPDLAPQDRVLVTPPPRLSESVDVELRLVDQSGRRSQALEVLAIEATEAVAAPQVVSLAPLALEGAGGVLPALALEIVPSEDARLLAISVQVRPADSLNDLDWRALPPLDPFAARQVLTAPAAPGAQVRLRLRAETRRGATSEWVLTDAVTLPGMFAPIDPGALEPIQADLDKLAQLVLSTQLTTDEIRSFLGRLGFLDGAAGGLGPVISRIEATADGSAELLELIGARTADGAAYILNGDVVRVSPTETLGERFTALNAAIGERASASALNQLTVRVGNTEGTLSAQATQISSLSVSLGQANATINQVSSVAADAQGKANALVGTETVVNGRRGGFVLTNDGQIVRLQVVVDFFDLLQSVNGAFVRPFRVGPSGVTEINDALVRNLRVFPSPRATVSHRVALRPNVVSGADGEWVSYGGSYEALPLIVPQQVSLPALPVGEAYDIRAVDVTQSAFRVRAKRVVAGALTPRTATGASNVGGAPQWRLPKPTSEDAASGNYQYDVTATFALVGSEPNPLGGLINEYAATFELWARAASGDWTMILTDARTINQVGAAAPASIIATVSAPAQIGFGLGLGEFGVHPRGTTVHGFSVRYATQDQSSESGLTGLFAFDVFPPT